MKKYYEENGREIVLKLKPAPKKISYTCPCCGEVFEYEEGVCEPGEQLCALCEYQLENDIQD